MADGAVIVGVTAVLTSGVLGPLVLHHNQPTVQTVAADPHDRDDLRDGGRVGRIPQTLVTRRATGIKAGNRRRRPATAGCVKNG